LEIDSEKVETNRYSIKEKYRITPSIIDYLSIVPALGLEIDNEKLSIIMKKQIDIRSKKRLFQPRLKHRVPLRRRFHIKGHISKMKIFLKK